MRKGELVIDITRVEDDKLHEMGLTLCRLMSTNFDAQTRSNKIIRAWNDPKSRVIILHNRENQTIR